METPNNNIQREKRKNQLYGHPWLSLLAVMVTSVFSIGLSGTVILGLLGLPDTSPVVQFAQAMSYHILTVFIFAPFALLTNQMDQVKPIGRMTTYRLLEMLTGSEEVYDQQVCETAREIDQQLLTLSLVTRKTVDPDKIAPFLGSYHNNELGDVKLVLHDDHTLWIDFGEYESSIRPLRTEENQYIFFESIFIGKTIQMKIDPGGTPTMKWTGEEGTYNFVATSVQE